MPTRRAFLSRAAAASLLVPAAARSARAGVEVNDIHSKLNATNVDRIVAVDSETTLGAALRAARGTVWPEPLIRLG